MTSPLDAYEIRARVIPALMCVLPALLTLIILGKAHASWNSAALTALGTTGALVLLSALAREPGKKLEPQMWASWGGPPTLRALRHRGHPNLDALYRLHTRLTLVIPHLQLPTAAEEFVDPDAADRLYQIAGAALRARTRTAFPLVTTANAIYGMWRNLYGLRRYGISFAMATALATLAAQLIFTGVTMKQQAAATVINLLIAVGWLSIARERRVRDAADDYAQRLLETVEQLPEPRHVEAEEASALGPKLRDGRLYGKRESAS